MFALAVVSSIAIAGVVRRVLRQTGPPVCKALSTSTDTVTLVDLEAEVASLKAQLHRETRERAAERAGRTRAERSLRDAILSSSSLAAAAEVAEDAGGAAAAAAGALHRFEAIGHLRSCFSTRNGTPRQPLLVASARATLALRRGVPASSLDGLDQYSHVWLLYVFHANTNAAPAAGGSVKAKVHVPRLGGASLGLFATRSPHRPCAIGLSVARVIEVDAARGTLTLGGADVVDGSPVLDVKPYLPFCDSLPTAVAPEWAVRERGDDDEPLRITAVTATAAGKAALTDAWRAAASSPRGSLYPTAVDFCAFVFEVLSRDIRSVRQRTLRPAHPTVATAPHGGITPPSDGARAVVVPGVTPASPPTVSLYPQLRYIVVLDNVVVGYQLLPDGAVSIVDAALDGSPGAARIPIRVAVAAGTRVADSRLHLESD